MFNVFSIDLNEVGSGVRINRHFNRVVFVDGNTGNIRHYKIIYVIGAGQIRILGTCRIRSR